MVLLMSRIEKTPVMVGQAKGIKLLALFVPIAAQATKTAGAVVQRITGDTYFGVGNRDNFAFKICKSGHGSSSLGGWLVG